MHYQDGPRGPPWTHLRRRSPGTARTLDQRRRLLRAVGEVVAERGYSEVTVEQIVKRAHVSFKTFYKHYGSKQECFEDLFEVAFAATEKKIGDALQGRA